MYCIYNGAATKVIWSPFVTFLDSFQQTKSMEKAGFAQLLGDSLNNHGDLLINHSKKGYKIGCDSFNDHSLGDRNPGPNCTCK